MIRPCVIATPGRYSLALILLGFLLISAPVQGEEPKEGDLVEYLLRSPSQIQQELSGELHHFPDSVWSAKLNTLFQ
ncbi:MAG: hypothetical protein HQL31_06805 [Planctomycetes bacterium]|nr:hypothetical protein [Planctomycetota bacterium]